MSKAEPPDPDHFIDVRILLPEWNEILGFSCATEWCESHPGFACGCPECLHGQGLQLVYDANDWRGDGVLKPFWRMRIVPKKTGELAPFLVVEHY